MSNAEKRKQQNFLFEFIFERRFSVFFQPTISIATLLDASFFFRIFFPFKSTLISIQIFFSKTKNTNLFLNFRQIFSPISTERFRQNQTMSFDRIAFIHVEQFEIILYQENQHRFETVSSLHEQRFIILFDRPTFATFE